MVVHAMGEWLAPQAGWTEPRLLLDVGGCASQLPEILAGVFPERFLIQVIDPGVNHTIEASPLGDGCAAVITCVSVLEHVEKWKAFLRATVRHLAPGGLLVLTMDYWDCEGPDTAHFHWMRRRIYNRASVTDLLNFLRDDLGCRRFGGVDWRFHGNHVYNYSFLATALIKDPLLLKESQP
jgi:SAM-dependent methyltransferase